MNCTNCGRELEPEEKFCKSCGTKAEAETPVEEAKESEAVIEGAAEITEPKKSRKGLFIGIGVAVAVLVAVILIALPFLKKDKEASGIFTEGMTDLEYFVALEQASAEKSLTLLSASVDKYAKFDIDTPEKLASVIDSKKADASVSLRLSEGITDYLSEMAELDLSFLKDMSLGLTFETSNGNSGAKLTLGLDGQAIITADAMIDAENSTAYLSIPELSDTAMKFNIEKLIGKAVPEIIDEVQDAMTVEDSLAWYSNRPEGKTISEAIAPYVDIILKSIITVEKSSVQVTVNGKSDSYTQLTARLTPDEAEAMILSVLERLKNDDELWVIIEWLGGMAKLDGEYFTKEAFLDSYDEIADSVNGSFDTLEGFGYSIIINDNEEIIGRELTCANGDSVSFICNENGLIFVVSEANSELVRITFDGTIGKDGCNGLLTAVAEGKHVLSVDVDEAKADGSSCKLTIVPGDGIKEMLEDIQNDYAILDDLDINLPESTITLSFGRKMADEYFADTDFDIALISDGKTAVQFNLGVDFGSATELVAPEKITDVDGVTSALDWLSGTNLLGFISNLPESVSNLAMGLVMSAING